MASVPVARVQRHDRRRAACGEKVAHSSPPPLPTAPSPAPASPSRPRRRKGLLCTVVTRSSAGVLRSCRAAAAAALASTTMGSTQLQFETLPGHALHVVLLKDVTNAKCARGCWSPALAGLPTSRRTAEPSPPHPSLRRPRSLCPTRRLVQEQLLAGKLPVEGAFINASMARAAQPPEGEAAASRRLWSRQHPTARPPARGQVGGLLALQAAAHKTLVARARRPRARLAAHCRQPACLRDADATATAARRRSRTYAAS